MLTGGSIARAGSRKTVLYFKTLFLSLIVPSFPLFGEPKEVSPLSHDEARRRMVKHQLRARGIDDEAVLQAMLKVPRHLFVEPEYIDLAYADCALPIKEKQTISQPFIVGLMTQSARLQPTDRVLEIGTGSGYQAAVLSELVEEVYTVEIVEPLARTARERLNRVGCRNVRVRHADGYQGWKEHAPYDVILITAASPVIPEPLLKQLKIGGRMVMPLGEKWLSQDLVVLTREKEGLRRKYITGVVFVPMTGEVREQYSP